MAKIYWDRFKGSSISTIQRVIVDTVRVPNAYDTGERDSFARQIVCETGRVLGSQKRYAHAEIDGGTKGLNAAECRAMADALMVAADVLDGKQAAEAIIAERASVAARLASSGTEVAHA